jgi:hypothetical protein
MLCSRVTSRPGGGGGKWKVSDVRGEVHTLIYPDPFLSRENMRTKSVKNFFFGNSEIVD